MNILVEERIDGGGNHVLLGHVGLEHNTVLRIVNMNVKFANGAGFSNDTLSL